MRTIRCFSSLNEKLRIQPKESDTRMSDLSTTYRDLDAHDYLDTHVQDEHHALMMNHLLRDVFGVCENERVLEVGAGSGRYTELLLERGYQVIATEPDPVMYNRLIERLPDCSALTPQCAGVEELVEQYSDVSPLCGFHVLHHLDEKSLDHLRSAIEGIAAANESFRGWFFLEPNPLNPMYPVQIALTSGMSFSEESKMWRPGMRNRLAPEENGKVRMGNIGLFPPRKSLESIPSWLVKRGTAMGRARLPWSAYTVYGGKYG
ncbi:MAG TPA: methyltransferase domain-containing protein [Candidatus Hydrogenedentes bacterium]|nr:methyltransferase domain-containing protein [Candidatus Hydrogenedentota bacterium]